MSKIDRYLLQSLRADETEPAVPTAGMFAMAEALEDAVAMDDMDIAVEDVEAGVEPLDHPEAVIPLLLRVERTDWDGADIPGLRINSRLGSVISAYGSVASLAALEEDDAVQSVEASRPVESRGELATSVPLVGGSAVHGLHGEEGDGALVAIVDAGIDVLHEAFRDADGRSRIVALWDQEDNSGVPAPHPFGYGTLHRRADVDGYIADGAVPAGLGRDPDGHGTHVASIAAGRAAGNFAGGMAPAARLVVVRSHQRRFEDGQVASLGYSHNHVDALAWIRDVAQAEGLPVAVNMSLGMNAGAHDGTSLLEIAFDEFSSGGRAPGRVIVKSAGNEGGRRGHAQLTVRQGDAATLRWRTLPVRRDQDLVEVWFRSGHDLEFELENPRGERSGAVSLGTPTAMGRFASGDLYDLDLERLHPDNGDSRLLVRVHRGGLPAVFDTGDWTLHVRARNLFGDCRLDAWIERRNTRPLAFTDHLVDEYSLSIPGTARTVVAVASVSPVAPFGVAASSSRGPTRDERTKPDVTAPGDGIVAARGGTETGTINKPGTSMAAPHVTGALALLLSHWGKRRDEVEDWRQLNAVQMRAALVQTSRGFSGAHDPAGGFGRLDARALVESFEAPAAHEPAVRVRPDVWKLEEWDDTLLWYARAIAEMQRRPIADPTSWRYQAAIHAYDRFGDPYADPADQLPGAGHRQRFWNQCQHSTWYFLPWHRMYLGYFEQIVAATVVQLGGPAGWSLPYWNYSDDANPDARRIPPAFRAERLPDGDPNPLRVEARVPAANAGGIVADDFDVDVVDCLDETVFEGTSSGGSTGFGGPRTGFSHGGGSMGKLEATPHGDIHVAVGGFNPAGFMSRFHTAGLDPLFWLHHANVDRLWNVWLRRAAGHVNPADDRWRDEPEFELHDAGGATVTLTSADVEDSATSLFRYRYEDETDPLAAAPVDAGGVELVEVEEEGAALTMDRTPAEMIGATESDTRLAGEAVTTRVELQAPTGPAADALALEEDGAPERIHLNIENVQGAQPVPHLVYVNLPEGADPADHPERLAGSLSMFGLPEASGADPEHPGSGLHYSLDITRVVEALGEDWSPDEVRVTLVPKTVGGQEPAAALEEGGAPRPIRIGRISVYRGG